MMTPKLGSWMMDDKVIFNHLLSSSRTYFHGHPRHFPIKPTAMMEAYESPLMVLVVGRSETKVAVVVTVDKGERVKIKYVSVSKYKQVYPNV